MLSAGNLSFTQSIVSLVEEWSGSGDEAHDIAMAKTMYRVARIFGEAMREVQRVDGASMAQHNTEFSATLILGGQIKGERPRLFHLYTPGNFIEATTGNALLPGRRDQIRPPGVRPHPQIRHAAGPGGQAGADFVRFDHALEPVGRPADRPALLRDAIPLPCAICAAWAKATDI